MSSSTSSSSSSLTSSASTIPSTSSSSLSLIAATTTQATLLQDFTTNLTAKILNTVIENVTTTSDYYSEYDSLKELPLGGMTEEEFFASLPVFDMFPLSFPTNSSVVLYAMLYALVFLIGVCGNVSVITLIRHVHSSIPMDNTMIFVIFLCCVDLASIVPLPMAIVDQLLGFWMFGTTLCKVYRLLEHVGRALSTFILAAMAFDRFRRVCYPHQRTSRRSIMITILILSSFTFILLSPLLIKASSEEIVLKEVLLENPYRLARVRIFKCLDHLEGSSLAIFVLYMFFIGFFIPVCFIFIFYALMVRRLFLRSRSIPTSQLPVNRIAGYTIAISVFFVLCWSPYWVAMLYNLYRTFYTIDLEQHTSEKFIYVMYGIHALPYVNSASNWLLYGLLNSQLMRRAHANKLNGQRSFGRDESRILPTFVVASNVKTPLTAATNIKEEIIKEDSSSIIVPRNSDSLL